jgi:hypothetical protein
MLSFRIEDGKAVEVTSEATSQKEGEWISRWDYKSLEQCEQIAQEATDLTSELHIAIERTSVSPKWDIIRAPHVGDKVSYSFNGDTYPCGTITSISKSMKVVTTSEGRKFYRRRQSGAWINAGTWALVQGHRYEQNPHF